MSKQSQLKNFYWIFILLLIPIIIVLSTFSIGDEPSELKEIIENRTYIDKLRNTDTIRLSNDKSGEDLAYKSYNSSTKLILIEDKDYKPIIKMRLTSPYVVSGLIASNDTKVAEFYLEDFKDGKTNLIDTINFYDVKGNYESISKTFRFKYGVENIECFEKECFNYTTWTEFETLDELPHKDIKISLWANTEVLEKIEWLPTIEGFKIFQWAEWDVSTAVYVQTYSITEESQIRDIFFKPGGIKMYAVGSQGDSVYEYNLTTAWDVSTVIYDKFFDFSAQEDEPQGLFFNPDGFHFYIIGINGVANNVLYEYNMSTAWDVSTAVYSQERWMGDDEGSPRGVFFKSDGLKMYITGSTGDKVYEYDLSTAWDISTESLHQTLDISGQANFAQDVFFSPNGDKMYTSGTAGDDLDEYDLPTAWDISTANYVQSLVVDIKVSWPYGIFFKSDGSKFYVTGPVYLAEYDLPIEPPLYYYNSTNTTSPNPNEAVIHNINWTDDIGLSLNFFETNITGSIVNFTTTLSGTSQHINITNITSAIGKYYWKSYANDSGSFWNSTNKMFVIVVDTVIPYFTSHSNNNSAPYYSENINLSIDVSDNGDIDFVLFSTNDSGSWANYSFQPTATTTHFNYTNLKVASAKDTLVGYAWYANDSGSNLNRSLNGTDPYYFFTVQNTAPLMASAVINNTSPYTNDPVNCTITASDADTDAMTFYYKWYDDYATNGTIFTSPIVSLTAPNWDKSNDVGCLALSGDGTTNSSWFTSTVNATIQNTLPTHATPILNATDHPSNKTIANITGYDQPGEDIDNDNIVYNYRWFESGTLNATRFVDNNSLVLYLPFDHNHTFEDNITYDYARDNDGTIHNDATWNSSGKIMGGYEFDGVNDHINISHSPSLSVSTYTLIVWIKAKTTQPIYSGIVGKTKYGTNEYILQFDAQGDDLIMSHAWGTYWDTFIDLTDIVDSWHQIAITYNGTIESVYLDGILTRNDTIPDDVVPSDASLWIGVEGSLRYFFNGSMDEIIIYNRSASTTEVQQHYDATRWGYANLDSSWTTKDDSWKIEMTPYDDDDAGTPLNSTAITIINSIPTISTMAWNDTTSVKTNDVVNCSIVASDVDSDSMTFYYKFYDDGSTNGTTFDSLPVLDLSTSGFDVGDIIGCVGLAGDGDGNSTWKATSTNFTIANTAPIMASAVINDTTPFTNEPINCSVSATDDDADTFTFYYNWYNSSVTNGSTFTSPILDLSTPNWNKDNEVGCLALVNDGIVNSSWFTSTTNATIQNSVPIVATAIINNTTPYTNDFVNCTMTASDIDEDAMTFYYNWYNTSVNNLTIFENSILDLSTPNWNRGNDVGCVVTSSDGTGNSSYFVSTINATIQNTIPTFTGDVDFELQDADTENMEDTYTTGFPNNDTTVGDEAQVLVLERDGEGYRTHIKFNITEIPDGAFIEEARLWLRFFSGSSSGSPGDFNESILIHHLWNQTWSEDSLTLNNQPCGMHFDNSAQCNLTAADILTVPLAGTWYNWTVTSIVRNETASNHNNVSFILKGPETTPSPYNIHRKFDSKEYANVTLRPILNGTYVDGPSINDTSPKTNDIINCTLEDTTYSDVDGDSGEFFFQWYEGGSLIYGTQTTTNSTLDLGLPNLDQGDNIGCRVLASDGTDNSTSWVVSITNATIQNSAPLMASAIINDTTPETNDFVNCSVTASDADSDSFTFFYKWYNNSVTNGTVFKSKPVLDLSTPNWDLGNIVGCTALAGDGTTNSSWFTSTINGTISDTTSPLYYYNSTNTTSPDTSEAVLHNINWTDDIGLSLNFFETNITGSIVNFTTILSGTSQDVNITNITSASGGRYYWKSYANDTYGNWNSTNRMFVILSAVPTVSSVEWNTTTNVKTDDFVNCTITAYDVNNDAMTFYYKFYDDAVTNGTIFESLPILDLSTSGFDVGDEVGCAGLAGDASGNSTWILPTTNITIANSFPSISSIDINSTLGTNLTAENITVYISSFTDVDLDSITNITDWRLNGQSIAVVNMPFDSDNSAGSGKTRDYSTFQNNGTLDNPTWTSIGKIGGAYEFDVGDKITYTDLSNDTDTVTAWVNDNGTWLYRVSEMPTDYNPNGINQTINLEKMNPYASFSEVEIKATTDPYAIMLSQDEDNESIVECAVSSASNLRNITFTPTNKYISGVYFYITQKSDGYWIAQLVKSGSEKAKSGNGATTPNSLNDNVLNNSWYHFPLFALVNTEDEYYIRLYTNSTAGKIKCGDTDDWTTASYKVTYGNRTGNITVSDGSNDLNLYSNDADGLLHGATIDLGTGIYSYRSRTSLYHLNGSQTDLYEPLDVKYMMLHGVGSYDIVMGSGYRTYKINTIFPALWVNIKGKLSGSTGRCWNTYYSYDNVDYTQLASLCGEDPDTWLNFSGQRNNIFYVKFEHSSGGAKYIGSNVYFRANLDLSGIPLTSEYIQPNVFRDRNITIDEVKVYNRSISSEQNEATYYAGLLNHSIETIVGQETEVGDVWSVAVTPNDGTDDGITLVSNTLTIVNFVPTVSSVTWNDTTDVKTNQTVNCTITASDDDNDAMTFYYKFYDNGVTNGSIFDSLPELDLKTSGWDKGDVVGCAGLAGDGVDNSTWKATSTNFTIVNTAPTHTTPILNATDHPSNKTTANITGYDQSKADADSDNIIFNYRWFKDNTLNATRWVDNSSTVLYLPFDKSDIKDYAQDNDGTFSDPVIDNFEDGDYTNNPIWATGCGGVTVGSIVSGYKSDYAFQINSTGGDGLACAAYTFSEPPSIGYKIKYACRGYKCHAMIWNGTNLGAETCYLGGDTETWNECEVDVTTLGIGTTKLYIYNDGAVNHHSVYDIFTNGTFPTDGRVEDAFEFDGVDDYIDLGTSIVISSTSTFTYMAWIKPNVDPSTMAFMGARYGDRDSFVVTSANALYMRFDDSYLQGGSVSDDEWQYVAVTYKYDSGNSGLDTQGRLYLNGVVVDSTISWHGGAFDSWSSGNRWVGWESRFNYYFNGSIDEVIIYNRSLSADEINQHYAATRWGYANLDSSWTTKGDSWIIEMTPYDKEESGTALNSTAITIENSVPAISTGVINNTSPYTNDPVNCTVTASDDDNDAMTFYYTWYNTSVTNGSIFTSPVLDLSTPNWDKGNDVGCISISGDGTGNSTSFVSTVNATINNSLPTMSNPWIGNYEEEPYENNLAAYYRLEGNGDDDTDNNNDGDLVDFGNDDDSGHTAEGRVGTAIMFDGTADNNFIKNPFNGFPSSEITVIFWMKSSDTTKSGTPFSYAATSDNEFLIYNYQSFAIYRGGSNVPTGISANDGDWHHIAVTWRGSDGQTKLYKDGVQAYSGTLASGTSITDGGSLVFGQEQDSVGGGFATSQAFLGTMDEVKIYNRTLSALEIQNMYNMTYKTLTNQDIGGSANNTADIDSDNIVYNYRWFVNETLNATRWIDNSSTVLYLPFDYSHSSNSITYDYALGNDGTVSGATWNYTGKIMGGYEFDGTNDYIPVPAYSGTLNFQDINLRTNFSISLWFKTTNQNVGISEVIGGNNPSSPDGHDRHIYLTNGNIAMRVYSGGGSPTSSGVNYADGGWHNVVMVVKQNDATYGYADGSLFDSDGDGLSDFTGSDGSWSDLYFIIGASDDATNDYFNGTIDEVIIYNRTLSALEIQQHYQAGLQQFSINRSETTEGDGWTIEVTPYDEETSGSPLNSTVLPIQGSCTYGVGDWNIDCADLCEIITDTYLPGGILNLYGTGTFSVLANIVVGGYLQDLNCEVIDKLGDGKTILVKL